MQDFCLHWLKNILGLIIISTGVLICYVCYDAGYWAGRKAGFNSVHEQLMNPCCDSRQPHPCCNK